MFGPSEDLYIVDQRTKALRVMRQRTGMIDLVAAFAVADATNFSQPTWGQLVTLNHPTCIARGQGSDAEAMYFVDSDALSLVRLGTDTAVSLVAGSGVRCNSTQEGRCGSGGPATAATFNYPRGIALRPNGNILVTDYGAQLVQEVVVAGPTATVLSIAGTGIRGFAAAGELATASDLNDPTGIAIDPATDEVIFADHFSCVIWRICGNGSSFGPAGTLAIVAGGTDYCAYSLGLVDEPVAGISIAYPNLLTVSPSGILYFGEDVSVSEP
jgi:hypothetical protein